MSSLYPHNYPTVSQIRKKAKNCRVQDPSKASGRKAAMAMLPVMLPAPRRPPQRPMLFHVLHCQTWLVTMRKRGRRELVLTLRVIDEGLTYSEELKYHKFERLSWISYVIISVMLSSRYILKSQWLSLSLHYYVFSHISTDIDLPINQNDTCAHIITT